MQKKDKPVLDNVPVQNKAFPNDPDYTLDGPLVPVSDCPSCGSPVYGPMAVSTSGPMPTVRYSCDCAQIKTKQLGTTKEQGGI